MSNLSQNVLSPLQVAPVSEGAGSSSRNPFCQSPSPGTGSEQCGMARRPQTRVRSSHGRTIQVCTTLLSLSNTLSLSLSSQTHTLSLSSQTHTLSLSPLKHTHSLSLSSQTHTLSPLKHTLSLSLLSNTHSLSLSSQTHSLSLSPLKHTLCLSLLSNTHSLSLSSQTHTHTLSLSLVLWLMQLYPVQWSLL